MPVNPACDPALLGLSNLVALWFLDETSGTTLADSSGNGHDGQLGGNGIFPGPPGGHHTLGVDPVACDNGLALRFNGDFDRVNIPADAAFRTTGAFTILAWLRRNFSDDDGDAGGGIFSCGGIPGLGGGYSLFITRAVTADAQFPLRLGISDASDYQVVTGTTKITYPEPHFLAGVYDGTRLKVYVDGVLDADEAATLSPTFSGTSRPIIGVDPIEPNSSTFSTLDNVAFVARALSDAEVLALYNACRCHPAMRAKVWIMD